MLTRLAQHHCHQSHLNHTIGHLVNTHLGQAPLKHLFSHKQQDPFKDFPNNRFMRIINQDDMFNMIQDQGLGESVDMRLQSPPAGASHFSHMSQSHIGTRPSSPRSSQDFGRSRQTSVSSHTFHGEYRQISQETGGNAPSYEYYQGSYQESGYPGTHSSTRQQDSQQQHQKSQQQPHQQLQQQQQQQQQHSQRYSSQYPPHVGSGYMGPSVPEIDRARSHSITAQQQQHYAYSPQSAPNQQQPQHTLISPPPRGQMQEIHSGNARPSIPAQHQQKPQGHHPQERPQPENDEALVMNFMSELQMQQQQQHHHQQQQQQQQHQQQHQQQQQQHHIQHSQIQGQQVHKQSRKSTSSPQVPQSASQISSQQIYSQHAQHTQIHHTPIAQQQQQHQQPMHIDHSTLSQSHGRFIHDDHHSYSHSHEPLPGSPVYRSQPSSVAPPAMELPRPTTPPGVTLSSVHPRPQGIVADTRQRPISGSGIGPNSPSHMAPRPILQPLESIKTSHGPGTPTGSAPRSASLMNILNVPEQASHNRHNEVDESGDMVDVQPISMHVVQEHSLTEPSIHQTYRQDPGQRTDYLPTFSETSRETQFEERFEELEQSVQVSTAEQDIIADHETGAAITPKTSKDKIMRLSKEKAVKDKIVKVPKEKLEKPKKERLIKSNKKKLSATAAISIESDDMGTDIVTDEQVLVESHLQESRSQEFYSQDSFPQESRLQDLHSQEPHLKESPSHDFYSQEPPHRELQARESRLQESHAQESHSHELHPQEPRPQEPRSDEFHPYEARFHEVRPQGPSSHETVGVLKHTLELPGGHRIELPSKKLRTETTSSFTSENDIKSNMSREADVHHPHESNDKTPIDHGTFQTSPIEMSKQTLVTTRDSHTEPKNTSTKHSSPQLSSSVALPPTESDKKSRIDDISPRDAPAAKVSSQVRSRSASPQHSLSLLRGHAGLGVELPGQNINGTSSSIKKNQQDSDRDRERTKVTVSKDGSKNSKTSSGGSITPKEKKSNKKEFTLDRSQDEDAMTASKGFKSTDGSKKSHDVDESVPSPKLPSSKTHSGSKKSTSSTQSQSTSLKKRFSRLAESEEGHLGSIGSKARENQDSSYINNKLTSEGSRGKLSKSNSINNSNITRSDADQQSTKSQKNSLTSSIHLPKEEDVEMKEQPESGEELYCICRTIYDPNRVMIACDGCDEWFHTDCVGFDEKDNVVEEKYYCKRCEEKGRNGSLKKKCFREGCQKSAGRKSKYCSKECGLLVATQRIQESQERVFGEESNQTDLPPGQVQRQQHLQRRRRLTLADLDDRQRLLGIREKMAHVRKVCMILEERTMQLNICVDRQQRQDLGKFDLSTVSIPGLSNLTNGSSSSPITGESKVGMMGDAEDDDEGILRSNSGSKSKARSKSQKERTSAKDKDKDAPCGFDYSLVWDDAQDIAKKDRAAQSSLVSTPVGSRASSVAPLSFGVTVIAPKQHDSSNEHNGEGTGDARTPAVSNEAPSPYLEAVGQRVCMSRRGCERHIGWQKLKAAELELEQILQNKLLKTLKAEAKLVKSRMKRRRNDLSARILNGTIEH
ncbi:hypothetical protein FBU30_003265 [Linnemannia zychae]|nr:hypothetical protein FBU30_003265 [Linnemannia zychae]